MKLFKQLLVAPAAIGLLTPIAANAAEVSINDIAAYASSNEVIQQASSKLSDVVPGDWAYTALQNLSASYGCLDNSYTQSLNNGQVLTRYEAAALVNACLDGGLLAEGESLNSDAIRLADEFGSEMAILKGRVEGLDSKINDLSAGGFSETTKFYGRVEFVTGALSNNGTSDHLHSSYAGDFALGTSFTGKDELVTGFEVGNSPGVLDIDPEIGIGSTLTVTDVFYTFPATDSIQVYLGPLMAGDEGLPGTSSVYGEVSRLGALPYSLDGASGVGTTIAYVGEGGFNAGINYTGTEGSDASSGIFSDTDGANIITAQIGYDGESFGGTFNYLEPDADFSAYGFGVYFDPDAGYSISASYDVKNNDDTDNNKSWMIGSEIDLGPGTLGVGIGTVDDTIDDEVTGYEAYYVYDIADGMSVTPTVFILPEMGDDDDSMVGAAVTLGFSF